jgi:hypothetical protein
MGKQFQTPQEAYLYWENQCALSNIKILPATALPATALTVLGTASSTQMRLHIPTQNLWVTAKAFVVFQGKAPGPYQKWFVYFYVWFNAKAHA